MSATKPVRRVVHAFNACAAGLTLSPRWGRLIGRKIVVITYTGRRSGLTFSSPVAYRRTGDDSPSAYRCRTRRTGGENFLGEGGPLTLHLNGTDRTGHAVARRSDHGRVTVRVSFSGQ